MTFSGAKSIDEVYTWLQMHYDGYKFGIVFDCTTSELQEPDKNFYVYFLDELTEEVMQYSDFYKVDKNTYKRRMPQWQKVRLIDTADKFLLEIDGKEIPHVSTYEISKSVLGYLTLKVMLSVNEVEELDIETDKDAQVVTK